MIFNILTKTHLSLQIYHIEFTPLANILPKLIHPCKYITLTHTPFHVYHIYTHKLLQHCVVKTFTSLLTYQKKTKLLQTNLVKIITLLNKDLLNSFIFTNCTTRKLKHSCKHILLNSFTVADTFYENSCLISIPPECSVTIANMPC